MASVDIDELIAAPITYSDVPNNFWRGKPAEARQLWALITRDAGILNKEHRRCSRVVPMSYSSWEARRSRPFPGPPALLRRSNRIPDILPCVKCRKLGCAVRAHAVR